MKKKLLLILSTAVVATSIVATTSAKDADPSAINLVVSGAAVECDQAPIIEEGRTLVPFRAVGEALGAEIGWEANTKTVTFDTAEGKVAFEVGGKKLQYTDKATNATVTADVDVPAKIVNGRTMVPVRLVAETLGFEVNWDAATRTVYVGSDAVETTTELTTEAVSEESTEETTVEETSVEVSTVEDTSAEISTEEETETVSEESTEETTVEVTTEA